MKIVKELTPEDFGISDYYCLNNKTIGYHKRKGNLIGEFHVTENPSTFFEALDELNDSCEEEREKVTKITTKPYGRAVRVLSDLKYRKSPIHKLKTIVKVAELMTVCIDDFYKSIGLTNDKKLDGDQTLSIFMYITSHAEITDIATHCKIIEKFSTGNILNSVSGYYATTLEACISCIVAMPIKDEWRKEEF